MMPFTRTQLSMSTVTLVCRCGHVAVGWARDSCERASRETDSVVDVRETVSREHVHRRRRTRMHKSDVPSRTRRAACSSAKTLASAFTSAVFGDDVPAAGKGSTAVVALVADDARDATLSRRAAFNLGGVGVLADDDEGATVAPKSPSMLARRGRSGVA